MRRQKNRDGVAVALKDDPKSPYFKIRDKHGTDTYLNISSSLFYRIFHICKGYGIRDFHRFEPNVKIIIGQAGLAEFASNIRSLVSLTNDKEIHDFAKALLVALESANNFVISTGDYLRVKHQKITEIALVD